jgi:peroxiredoxin
MLGLTPGGRRRAAAGSVALVLLVGVAVVAGLRRSDHRSRAPQPLAVHEAAPDFTSSRASLQGGAFSLRSARGHPLLLSFLNTQATSAGDPSRPQIVFLKSMNTQNHPYGLWTVIVDESTLAGLSAPSRSTLVNFTFDWALDRSIAVVGDGSGSIERAYGVTKVPTTFLIDKHGIVRRRWNGFALAAQLDFAIRPLVGRAVVDSPGGTTSG